MHLKISRRVKLSVATVVGGIALAAATPAFADITFVGSNQPTVVSAAQGSTTTLNWTVLNTGSTGVYGDAANGPVINGTITFNAPTGTTFPAQATVPTAFSFDGTTFGSNEAVLDGCTVGGGGTTLTCTIEAIGSSGGAYQWPTGGYFRYSPTVVVSSTATPGTYSAAANVVTPYNSNPGTTIGIYDITYGTLDISITPVAAVPVIDPRLALLLLPIGGLGAFAVRRARRSGQRDQLAA